MFACVLVHAVGNAQMQLHEQICVEIDAHSVCYGIL